jgi:hypothetical protein
MIYLFHNKDTFLWKQLFVTYYHKKITFQENSFNQNANNVLCKIKLNFIYLIFPVQKTETIIDIFVYKLRFYINSCSVNLIVHILLYELNKTLYIIWVCLKHDELSEKCFNGTNVIIRLIKRVAIKIKLHILEIIFLQMNNYTIN